MGAVGSPFSQLEKWEAIVLHPSEKQLLPLRAHSPCLLAGHSSASETTPASPAAGSQDSSLGNNRQENCCGKCLVGNLVKGKHEAFLITSYCLPRGCDSSGGFLGPQGLGLHPTSGRAVSEEEPRSLKTLWNYDNESRIAYFQTFQTLNCSLRDNETQPTIANIFSQICPYDYVRDFLAEASRMANEKMVFTSKQPQILHVLISPEVHESLT